MRFHNPTDLPSSGCWYIGDPDTLAGGKSVVEMVYINIF